MDEATEIQFQQIWKQQKDLNERIGDLEQALMELAKRIEAIEKAASAKG